MSLTVEAVIEIPKDTNVKYEFDYDFELLRVDRILNVPFVYPSHYGYIPKTLAEDGDCLDVLIISDFNLIPGCIIKGKVIGVLLMEDEKGIDHKIICVPADDVDKKSTTTQSLDDINSSHLKKIEYFFEHYKDLEKDKWVKVIRWGTIQEAQDIITKSQLDFTI